MDRKEVTKRLVLRATFYIMLVLVVVLLGLGLSVHKQAERLKQRPAYRVGSLMGAVLPNIPPPMANFLSKLASGGESLMCLRGFYMTKYSKAPKSIKDACPSFPVEAGRACSEAIGKVLIHERYPDP